ncbi:tyrosine recombinase XerC [soil metagenome]
MTLLFDDAIRQFESYLRVEKNLSPRTRNAYLYDLGRFREFHAPGHAIRTDQVTDEHIRSYIHHVTEDLNYRPTTLSRTISSIRVFFDFLVEQGHLDASPAAGFVMPKKAKKLPVYLVDSELKRLFDAPDQSTTAGVRDRAMLVAMAFCGMRLQELVGLNLSDFDFPSQTVKVLGKGSKERLIPMNPEVEKAIGAWLPLRVPVEKERAVFLNRFGRRISGRMVEMIVDKYVLAAGISKSSLSPHKLRHTFATMLHSRDVDLVEIQTLLGHANLATTQIYTHTNTARLQEAVERINIEQG